MRVDQSLVERDQIERLRAYRANRSDAAVGEALRQLEDAARNGDNIMPPSIAAAPLDHCTRPHSMDTRWTTKVTGRTLKNRRN